MIDLQLNLLEKKCFSLEKDALLTLRLQGLEELCVLFTVPVVVIFRSINLLFRSSKARFSFFRPSIWLHRPWIANRFSSFLLINSCSCLWLSSITPKVFSEQEILLSIAPNADSNARSSSALDSGSETEVALPMRIAETQCLREGDRKWLEFSGNELGNSYKSSRHLFDTFWASELASSNILPS